MYELGDLKLRICEKYFDDATNTKLLGIAISMVIVLFNYILKRCIVSLVYFIGEDTVSQ